MVNVVQNNLVIVGLTKLFWKGAPVEGVKNIRLKKNAKKAVLCLVIENGDANVINELREAGVYIREE